MSDAATRNESVTPSTSTPTPTAVLDLSCLFALDNMLLPTLADVIDPYLPDQTKKPRSSNKFILFRTWVSKALGKMEGSLVGHLWNELKDSDSKVVRHFTSLASEANLAHSVAFPGYKYQPEKKDKKEKGGTKTKKRTTIESGKVEKKPKAKAAQLPAVYTSEPLGRGQSLGEAVPACVKGNDVETEHPAASGTVWSTLLDTPSAVSSGAGFCGNQFLSNQPFCHSDGLQDIHPNLNPQFFTILQNPNGLSQEYSNLALNTYSDSSSAAGLHNIYCNTRPAQPSAASLITEAPSSLANLTEEELFAILHGTGGPWSNSRTSGIKSFDIPATGPSSCSEEAFPLSGDSGFVDSQPNQLFLPSVEPWDLNQGLTFNEDIDVQTYPPQWSNNDIFDPLESDFDVSRFEPYGRFQ